MRCLDNGISKVESESTHLDPHPAGLIMHLYNPHHPCSRPCVPITIADLCGGVSALSVRACGSEHSIHWLVVGLQDPRATHQARQYQACLSRLRRAGVALSAQCVVPWANAVVTVSWFAYVIARVYRRSVAACMGPLHAQERKNAEAGQRASRRQGATATARGTFSEEGPDRYSGIGVRFDGVQIRKSEVKPNVASPIK